MCANLSCSSPFKGEVTHSVILRVNRAFTEITGYTSEEAVGQTPRLLSSGRHDAAFYAAMWESLQSTGAWQGEIWNRRKNGDVFPERLTITAVKGDDGEVTVARFGGDEFMVMLGELAVDKAESATQAGIVAEKIRATLAEPYVLKLKHEVQAETTVEHRCTTSIGVVLFIDHQARTEEIIKWADMAMYQAKEAGGNLIRFYESTGE